MSRAQSTPASSQPRCEGSCGERLGALGGTCTIRRCAPPDGSGTIDLPGARCDGRPFLDGGGAGGLGARRSPCGGSDVASPRRGRSGRTSARGGEGPSASLAPEDGVPPKRCGHSGPGRSGLRHAGAVGVSPRRTGWRDRGPLLLAPMPRPLAVVPTSPSVAGAPPPGCLIGRDPDAATVQLLRFRVVVHAMAG